MIEPGKIGGRVCHGCRDYLTHDAPTVIVGIVRSGVEKTMLVVLCGACAQSRLGSLECANISRRDLANFFDILAQGGGIHVNG